MMDLVYRDNQEAAKTEELAIRVADLCETEETLLRFLRAREGDIIKAEQMIRQSRKWREDNKVDSFKYWIPPKILAEDFKVDYLGEDFEGYPALHIALGRWNIRDRIQDGYLKDTMNYRFWLLEAVVMEAINKSSKSQFVAIADMAELSFYKVAHIETMNAVIRICRDFDANYPERLKAAFIVNAPWAFPYAFNLVKPWVAAKTLAKVQIFDSDRSKWLPAVETRFPLRILPRNLL